MTDEAKITLSGYPAGSLVRIKGGRRVHRVESTNLLPQGFVCVLRGNRESDGGPAGGWHAGNLESAGQPREGDLVRVVEPRHPAAGKVFAVRRTAGEGPGLVVFTKDSYPIGPWRLDQVELVAYDEPLSEPTKDASCVNEVIKSVTPERRWVVGIGDVGPGTLVRARDRFYDMQGTPQAWLGDNARLAGRVYEVDHWSSSNTIIFVKPQRDVHPCTSFNANTIEAVGHPRKGDRVRVRRTCPTYSMRGRVCEVSVAEEDEDFRRKREDGPVLEFAGVMNEDAGYCLVDKGKPFRLRACFVEVLASDAALSEPTQAASAASKKESNPLAWPECKACNGTGWNTRDEYCAICRARARDYSSECRRHREEVARLEARIKDIGDRNEKLAQERAHLGDQHDKLMDVIQAYLDKRCTYTREQVAERAGPGSVAGILWWANLLDESCKSREKDLDYWRKASEGLVAERDALAAERDALLAAAEARPTCGQPCRLASQGKTNFERAWNRVACSDFVRLPLAAVVFAAWGAWRVLSRSTAWAWQERRFVLGGSLFLALTVANMVVDVRMTKSSSSGNPPVAPATSASSPTVPAPVAAPVTTATRAPVSRWF